MQHLNIHYYLLHKSFILCDFLNCIQVEKAIHFIQAEKLYYENALINTEEIKKKLGNLSYFI